MLQVMEPITGSTASRDKETLPPVCEGSVSGAWVLREIGPRHSAPESSRNIGLSCR